MQALEIIAQNKASITKAKQISKEYKQVILICRSKALFAELPRSLQIASSELIKARHGVWLFCEQVETAINAIDDDRYSYLLKHKLFNNNHVTYKAIIEHMAISKASLYVYEPLALLAFYDEYLKIIS